MNFGEFIFAINRSKGHGGGDYIDVLFVEPDCCIVLGSFVHHTVDVPIQSR